MKPAAAGMDVDADGGQPAVEDDVVEGGAADDAVMSSHHDSEMAAKEYEESEEESRKAREKQEQVVMRRRAGALAVPTSDGAVRARLRSVQHPPGDALRGEGDGEVRQVTIIRPGSGRQGLQAREGIGGARR